MSNPDAPAVGVPGPEDVPYGAGDQLASVPTAERLALFWYLSQPERDAYIAIMRLFSSTLMADLSSAGVSDQLEAGGILLPPDVSELRLEALVAHGNLIRARRDTRVASISEYQRARGLYQVSKLGGQVQRLVDQVIATVSGAREVSREVLGLIASGLAGLHASAGNPEVQSGDLAAAVTTLFLQHGEFSDSTRDFYAYLGQVLGRFDLAGDDFAGFKNLLVDYVDGLQDDVLTHGQAISVHLDELWPVLPVLLARLDEGSPMAAYAGTALGEAFERSRGRTLDDWIALRAWYTGAPGTASQLDVLRASGLQAMQSLLMNFRRMVSASSNETSRRRDLLRLAAWFDSSDSDQAHALWTAAYGLYPARHLYGMSDDPTGAGSWWYGPCADVAISLRERGDRSMRGRASRPSDYSAQKAALLARAAQEAAQRREAALELLAVGDRLAATRISDAAFTLLTELLSTAMAALDPDVLVASATSMEADIQLTLARAPGAITTLACPRGTLALDDLTVAVHAAGLTESLDDSSSAGAFAAAQLGEVPA